MNFITRFSDRRNKFRHRLEVKYCWPDDMNVIPNAQQMQNEQHKKDNKGRDTWTRVLEEDLKQNIYR